MCLCVGVCSWLCWPLLRAPKLRIAPRPRRPKQRARTPRVPQMRGANVECDGMVWRIDVGMSSGVLDAPVSVLEITRDVDGMANCRVLTEGEGINSFDEPDALVDF